MGGGQEGGVTLLLIETARAVLDGTCRWFVRVERDDGVGVPSWPPKEGSRTRADSRRHCGGGGDDLSGFPDVVGRIRECYDDAIGRQGVEAREADGVPGGEV